MVELIARIETMNERLGHLEMIVQDHIVTNAASSSSLKDQCCRQVNETKSIPSAKEQDADDGSNRSVSMTQNLNNILARLTLLENSMKYLNDKQVCKKIKFNSFIFLRYDYLRHMMIA